jgi:hypothetical protein
VPIDIALDETDAGEAELTRGLLTPVRLVDVGGCPVQSLVNRGWGRLLLGHAPDGLCGAFVAHEQTMLKRGNEECLPVEDPLPPWGARA